MTLDRISLAGLELAPPQVWGGIRVVPLLRASSHHDLRLGKRRYDDVAVVSLDGELNAPGIKYVSYVPHGLVVDWTHDGAPVAAFGGRLDERADGKRLRSGVRLVHRMVRRIDENRLRLLPLHVAMEGFLALCFGGPDIAWSEYSQSAIRDGLSPRYERAVSGHAIYGLEAALRVFEIHERQVGMLLFVADAFTSAFVVPSSADYRLLHRSLLEDFYGPLVLEHSLYAFETPMAVDVDASNVRSLADLRENLLLMRAEWAAFSAEMAAGLLDVRLKSQHVYKAGPFVLERFVSELNLDGENHIGEAIVRSATGEIEYLKTYRLSAAQTRRAYLLQQLAAHRWSLERTAEALQQTKDALIRRIEGAGFGYLIKPHVLEAANR